MSFEFIETVYGKLPSNLKEAKLSTICEKNGVQTGPFGSQLHKEDYVVKGTPIITVEHLGENRIVHENLPRVSDKDRTRLSKYQLKTGDIVFSRVGSVDRRALVQAKEDGWLFSGRCLRVRPIQEIVDSRWLSYFFGLPAFKTYIRSIAVGATMPSLNTTILSDIPIYFPPLDIQKSAARILIDLDDRITLLRETNATLEAIAQTLFKSWFVDFDPVRAKQQGCQPEGMDSSTAALFPDSFEESELGMVPMGWRVGTLGQIADTVRSQRKPSELNSDTNYVGLEHIPRRCLSLANWGSAEVLESAKSCFSKDDILFGKLRPYFHKVVIAPFDGVCSTDILVCQSKLREYYGLVTMHLFSKTLIDYAERLSNGAKMPRINWKDLAAYPIVLPPPDVAESYRVVVDSLFQTMLTNIQQAQTLSTLRDTLLPRLISGQLRIDDIENLAVVANN
jgi:type I restriction enzyme S subunit